MLYYLLDPLVPQLTALNLIRYITFRTAAATVTAFAASLVLAPAVIRWLRAHRVSERVEKKDSARLRQLHAGKRDTPTMGGLAILMALMGSTLLWARFLEVYVLLVLAVVATLGLVGLADDYIKLTRPKGSGLTARQKLAAQAVVGLAAGAVLLSTHRVQAPPWDEAGRPALALAQAPATELEASLPLRGPIPPEDREAARSIHLPFAKHAAIPLGVGFLLFAALVIAGSSNAFNLTDGLDGLAIGIMIPVCLTLLVAAYLAGRMDYSAYLFIPHVPGAGELAVFCGALLGAGLGFLWFNCHPAEVFMGDTGSLPLGGGLAAVALVIKQEALLAIAGGIFVLEALSVVAQVASYRVLGRRVLRCAPFHHDLQFRGWPESKVTVRLWILGSFLALAALATLKVR
ncbi:MAG: phospho-N-acetylmuramoyl-pentapeptide-transferase [Planctomycetes bacterium]|nr:phospho-N-acetylmuramoyl-pentapeptide-transferase [Planctomycetota bacterium]